MFVVIVFYIELERYSSGGNTQDTNIRNLIVSSGNSSFRKPMLREALL